MILAEWNLNIAENIEKIGNYRYRPTIQSPTENNFGVIAPTYDSTDAKKAYTGATDSDIQIDGGYDKSDNPITFTTAEKKKEFLFSLEQCFDRFRPRSGINKMIYNDLEYINDASKSFATRPRYYLASREDVFKYWTSVRSEDSKLTGISYKSSNKFYIDDAAPFVVYKNVVPTNRIITKIQTHVGTTKIGEADPFYGEANMAVPKEWKIQYLDESGVWQDAKTFNTVVFGADGYLELQYGLIVPEEYDVFIKAPTINSIDFLPENAPDGYSYLLIENTGEKGVYFTRNSANTVGDEYNGNNYPGWDKWVPTYGWYVGNEVVDTKSSVVSNLTNPESYIENNITKYREFSHIRGVRLVVSTMNKLDARLDLIEISPRLAADLSDVTTSYSTTRQAADLGSSPFPVGSLVASTGSLDLFDYDLAFSNQNKKSILNVVKNDNIVYNISNKNMQVKFYEIIENVSGKDYYVPIKVLYAEGFPEVSASERTTTIGLRDLFFFFESVSPQDTVMIDQPLSYIIATLLDSVGFSNYKFYRLPGSADDIVPYFFISKDSKVSQVLNELAVATQSAMFFDETNNLIIASRDYMFPKKDDRKIEITLNGTKDQTVDGAYRNKSTQSILANIMEISSQQEDIYNDGKITYSPKYIQKTVRDIEQASKLDKERNWVYKPVMLWEVSQTDTTKSINGEASNSQGMALTAIPLKTPLSDKTPEVSIDPKTGQKVITNNTISFGDSVYFVGRYNGYFYANGEIIKYDAVEYSCPSARIAQLSGTIDVDSDIINLSSGNTTSMFVGQPIFKTSGGATITGSPKITRIINDKSIQISIKNVDNYPSNYTGDKTSITFDVPPTMTRKWVSSLEEYEELFANIPFNGKLYPTGRVRIYTEAQYDANDQLTGVSKHGRGQFGTKIVSHSAGLDQTWKKNKTGCEMDMDLIINGGNTLLSTVGEIKNASETANAQGLYTAEIHYVKSINAFYANQEISASSLTTLSETGTIYEASTTKTNNLYTAKIKDLVSTDYFYVGQVLDATSGEDNIGSFNASNEVKVASIVSTTEITVTGTAALTNGPVTNIRADLDSGDLAGKVTVTLVSGTVLNISSTDKMKNGPISNIVTPDLPKGGYGLAGKTSKANTYSKNTTVEGLMKNYLSTTPLSEDPKLKKEQTSQLVQSSALIINGPSFPSTDNPVDFITYSYREMPNESKFTHFGTRARIIGQSGTSQEKLQTPVGSAGWTTIDGKTVAGSSGGLAVLLNPDTNIGYYFEIAAFTDNNVVNYTGEVSAINNVYFYKMRSRYDYLVSGGTALQPGTYKIENGVATPNNPEDSFNIASIENESLGQIIVFENQTDARLNGSWRIDKLTMGWKLTKVEPQAIPETLWAGLTSIVTDSGQFIGAGRVLGEDNPSVYDLAVEYVDRDGKRQFYLYINGIKIGEVVDTEPTKAYKGVGLFSRGSARVMFENFYALNSNYGVNTQSLISAPINSVFMKQDSLTKNAAFTKYALSGAIQSTYLSGIGTEGSPQYEIFYDEFGTIMREAAYFNIRYEDAYPALRAMVAPTLNTEKGYTISGFMDTPYGAEFLIFNNTDTILALDETTGNYLRILGITFTQQSSHDLTVDDYFNEIGNLSNVDRLGQVNLSANNRRYQDIKNSRVTYGTKEFSLESPYIQSRNTAEKMMEWTIGRLSKPRKSIGISIFPNPLIQIGDLATIDYKDKSGMDILGTDGTQFVVYSIEYQKSSSGPSMVLHLSEVY